MYNYNLAAMLYNLLMIKKLFDRIFKPKHIKPDAARSTKPELAKPQQSQSNRPLLGT